MCYTKFIKNYGNYLYLLFRLMVGVLFFQHAGQKLFGWFGGVPLTPLMIAAGIIEFAGSILIFLGLFTRLAATITALEKLAAYGIVHLSQGFIPFQFGGNGGELALMYFAAFLVLIIYGAGKASLERRIFNKEFF